MLDVANFVLTVPKSARLILNYLQFSCYPFLARGTVTFVSLFALRGQRPKVRGGGCVTYHSAAEGPEPPEESQGQEEEQDQQGDCQDGAIGLWGQERGWLAVGLALCATSTELGWGKATPVVPHPTLPSSVCRFKAQRCAQFAKQMAETLPSILGNTLYIVNSHEKQIPLFREALFFSLNNILKD